MNTVKLGDLVASVQSGFASGEDDALGVVQVRMNNISTNGGFDWSKIRRVPRPKNLEKMLVQPGDILFNSTNSPDLVGKSALFSGYAEPLTFSNHFLRIRLESKRAHSGFISRILQSFWMKRSFVGLCKQWVNQASVSKDDLLNLDIPIVPLPEQKRIAAILDQADELRRKRRQAIELLDSLSQAIFDQMFSDRSVEAGIAHDITLADLVRKGDHINYGVVQPGSECDSGVPLVRVANIVANDFSSESLKKIEPSIEAQYRRSRLCGDEVLVACVGSVGAVALATPELTNANIARAVARIPVDTRIADRVYVAEFLKLAKTQQYFRAEIRAVAQPTLNIKQLSETRILLPPIEKQQQFARRVAEVGALRSFSSGHLAKLDALFASLQHRAFTGQLTARTAEQALAQVG